jgi:small nuclear ribonucleoprotein (snRNP)-like protein|tara:strand:+ start:5944 stop:6867 length:924 start_codon:yes stop_codon:yes gene_type:complete
MESDSDGMDFDFESVVDDAERGAGDFLPSGAVDDFPSSRGFGVAEVGKVGRGSSGGTPHTATRDFAPIPLPAGFDPSLRLDFRSKYFDPHLALTAKPPPDPPRKVRPLENVRRFRRVLPVGDPLRIDPTSDTRRVQGKTTQTRDAQTEKETRDKEKEKEAAKALAMDRAENFRVQGERATQRTPVLQALALEEKQKGGPVANVLSRAMELGIRIAVRTRFATGVRGTAVAYLKAFDRHMNMILVDVTETSAARTKVWRTKTVIDERTGATHTKTKQAYKLVQKTRHLQQVFVRGEQVVLVSVADEAG